MILVTATFAVLAEAAEPALGMGPEVTLDRPEPGQIREVADLLVRVPGTTSQDGLRDLAGGGRRSAIEGPARAVTAARPREFTVRARPLATSRGPGRLDTAYAPDPDPATTTVVRESFHPPRRTVVPTILPEIDRSGH